VEDTVPADTAQDLAHEEDPGLQASQAQNREENLGHQATQALAREQDPGIPTLHTIEVVVEDNVEMTAEMGANNAEQPTIVGVTNVERVTENTVLDADATSELEMVLDKAVVSDIPTESDFKSDEKKDESKVPRKGTQTVVADTAVNEGGEHAAQGERDRICDLKCETPDDGALDDVVWFDATEDEFKADSVMTQENRLVNNKLDDGGISPDRGEGDAKFHGEETQKKPPDPGYMKFKWISPGLLKTGILLMHLLLMMNPMIMMSGSVMMNTSGDGHRIHDTGFVYKERDTMGDAVVISMKTDLCPTGGRENILRFDKSVDAAGDNCPC
jgi:hypothetical protein